MGFVHLDMDRIIAIDYGTKRCGIAETDDLQIIASALTTIPTAEALTFLNDYCTKNKVETAVFGLPVRASGELSEVETHILKFIKQFKKANPDIRIDRVDESYTSKRAMEAMLQSGAGKKKRRAKENLDKISATLILQNYLETKRQTL